MDFNAGDSVNELGVRSHGERGLDEALRRRALVDVCRARFQRQVRIVDIRGEVCGIDGGIVRSAAQFLTYLVTGSELILAGGYGVLVVGFCLQNARLPALRVGNVGAHPDRSPVVALGTFLARVQAVL